MENELKNFLFSLPADIQVALDELIQEGFEVDFYDPNIEGHIIIYLPKINYLESAWFSIYHKIFCYYLDESRTEFERINIYDLKPNIFKEKVKENLKWK